MQPVLRQLAAMYAPYFQDYKGMREEALLHHADPHEKRDLRIEAWLDLVESGRVNTDVWAYSKHGVPIAEGKLKTEEYAKPGKKPRMIVDLGVAASLQGFRLTEYLKTAQSKEILHYKGGMIQFVKDPSPDTLKVVFKRLIEPPGRFYFVYFSDDACFSIRRGGQIYSANIDISSCDASHTSALFEGLVAIMPGHCRADMRVLVDQCRYALRIVSCDDPRDRVLIRPKTPRLYSGSTITTAINNLANVSIAIALADADACTADEIVAAAATAGYVVTVDAVSRPEEFQFLKHSPVLGPDGEYHPMINFGVIVRLSGCCKRDLPGSGPLYERARQFQAALLNGLCPGATFPLLQRMREKVAGPISREFVERVAAENHWRPLFTAPMSFTDEDVLRRYSTDPTFVDELYEFADTGFEEQFSTGALTTVLAKDYGLEIVPVGTGVQQVPQRLIALLLDGVYEGKLE